MKYDVFISYSRDDEEWATRLEAELSAPGYRVFRDVSRLQGGDLWEQGLTDAVRNSRHLVFLGSAKGRASDWVTREIGLFETVSSDPKQGRRLIALNLEGTNRAYASLQTIETLKDANAYAGTPDQVGPNVWTDVRRRIRDVIDDQDDAVKIAVAVLTMTEDEADPDPGKGSKLSFEPIRESFQIEPAEVKARYGPDRLDWRPYGGKLTIRSTIDQLVDGLNGNAGGAVRFAWRPAPDTLWGATVQETAAQIAAAPLSLIVVDTLALKHPVVYQRMMTLRHFLKHVVCSWVLIPPTASDPILLSYRSVLQDWSMPLLTEYFDPPIPRDVGAPHFGIQCGDEREIRRLLRLAAGEYVARNASNAPRAEFLKVGERS